MFVNQQPQAPQTPEESTPPTPPAETPRTFTQDQVNALIAEEKRKLTSRFADYDEVKTKASDFDKLAEAQKTELQKALDRADKAEKKAAELAQREEISAWKQQVEKETGVPSGVLAGTTLEEIQAHAEQIKPLLASTAPDPTNPSQQPVPTVGQTPPPPTGNTSLAEQIQAAEKAGNKDLVAQLKVMQLGAAFSPTR